MATATKTRPAAGKTTTGKAPPGGAAAKLPSETYFERAEERIDLIGDVTGLRVFWLLANRGPMTTSAIAEAIGLTVNAVATRVGRMHTAKLLGYGDPPEGERGRSCSLTAAGVAFWKNAQPFVEG